MSSSPPTTLGKYQIIREIARSNDIVYEAYDPQMDRRVALKELALPGGATDAQKKDRIERFEREVKAAGRLQHPNIMTVYEVGEDSGRHYMAMEFLDGHTLRNELDTHGFLATDRAIEIALSVLGGLEHAHANGVIHRDIKPDNIQILSDGRIKITDFGIARLTFQPNLTMDGQVFGTPSYMSPEQVVGRDIDARSDVFSVGVVLYEMLGGRKPFTGDSVVSIAYAITNREPDPLPQANHSIAQVIARALDKSPAMRYGSAGEMMQALRDAQASALNQVLDPPAPSPAYNPYVHPAPPPAIGPPPVIYPYNPYAQPGQTSVPPHTPGLPPGFTFPVYYPPPPRPPLLKPETRQFLGRLVLSIVMLGTLFGLIIVGINALATASQRLRGQASAPALRQDPSRSVEDRLRERLIYRSQLAGDAGIDEDRNIAVLYQELGKKQMGLQAYALAESSFRDAIARDRTNPAYHADLGDLYSRMVEAQQEEHARLELSRQAAEAWQNAAAFERDEARQRSYAEAAAISLYNVAVALLATDDRSAARQALYDAERMAPRGTQVEEKVRDLLIQLS